MGPDAGNTPETVLDSTACTYDNGLVDPRSHSSSTATPRCVHPPRKEVPHYSVDAG